MSSWAKRDNSKQHGIMCSSSPEYKCSLSQDTLRMAIEELHEDPQTRHLEMRNLCERLQRYPGLHPWTNPIFLLAFLRVRKFDQEKAFQMVLGYYRMRQEFSGVLDGLKPSALHDVMIRAPFGVALPYPDRQGRHVAVVSPARLDFDRFDADDILRCCLIQSFHTFLKEEVQVRGILTILDLKDFSLAQFLGCVGFRHKLTRIIEECAPKRSKGVLIVNESGSFDLVMEFLRHVLKSKIMSRVQRLGTDWKRLHEFIDPAHLPPEYGGTLDDTLEGINQKYVQVLDGLDSVVEEEGRYGFVNFTLAKDAANTEKEDAFVCLPGTYRKLEN